METTKIVYDEKYTRYMQISDYVKEIKFYNVIAESLHSVTTVYDEKFTRAMQILDYVEEMKFNNVRVENFYDFTTNNYVTTNYVNNIKNVCKVYGNNDNVTVSIKIESIIFKEDTLTLILKGDIIKFNNVKILEEVTINGNKKVKIEKDVLVFVDKSFGNHIISIELPNEKNNRFIAVYDSIVNVREITNVEKKHKIKF